MLSSLPLFPPSISPRDLAMATMSESLLRLPKAILHTHLEGSIPEAALLALSRRNGVDPALVRPFRGVAPAVDGHWPAFAKTIKALFSCFQCDKDFLDATLRYGESLARENVVYAEVHCSPWKHLKRGISLATLEAGLRDGAQAAQERHGVDMRFICDLVRDADEDVPGLLDWLSTVPRTEWPAIGISGGLHSVPLRNMRSICDRAHGDGLAVVAHAGELSGPESVRTAVHELKVDRISHGVRVLEDAELTETILACGMHLELCPTANRLLRIGEPHYRSIARLLQMQANCSINPDDEFLFDTSLTREYTVLHQCEILDLTGVLRLQRAAFGSAFLSDTEKAVYQSRLTTAWDSLHQTPGDAQPS